MLMLLGWFLISAAITKSLRELFGLTNLPLRVMSFIIGMSVFGYAYYRLFIPFHWDDRHYYLEYIVLVLFVVELLRSYKDRHN